MKNNKSEANKQKAPTTVGSGDLLDAPREIGKASEWMQYIELELKLKLPNCQCGTKPMANVFDLKDQAIVKIFCPACLRRKSRRLELDKRFSDIAASNIVETFPILAKLWIASNDQALRPGLETTNQKQNE